MSDPLSLPARPDLDWLKRRAKERLAELRAAEPSAKLAEAQLAIARDYGFPSWRALKARVDELRSAPATPVAPAVTADDVVRAFLSKVGTGDATAVRAALDAAPAFANAVGPHPFWGGRAQALHVAIESNRRELFALLLERGADPDGANDGYGGWSPLLLAAHRRRDAMVAALRARGARVGVVEALALGDDALLDRRLGDPAALPAAPGRGTLLHFARTPHAIDRLLERGVAIDAPDRHGTTPVEALSRLGRDGASLVAHLVTRGARAGAVVLARTGDVAAVERLHAGDPGATTSPAAFRAAVDSGSLALVRRMLDWGADPNAPDDAATRVTPLHAAAWNGDRDMVRELLEAGADPDARDTEHDTTPLGWAETAARIRNERRCAEVAELLRPRTAPA